MSLFYFYQHTALPLFHYRRIEHATYILAVEWSMKEKNRCRRVVDRVGTISESSRLGLSALTKNGSLNVTKAA